MSLFSRKPKQTGSAPATDQVVPPEHDPTPPTAASAPPASGGPLVENTLVQAALLKWGERKNAQTMNEVLRQCATGELLIDISASEFADISRGFQPGDKLNVGQVVDNAGKRLLLVFTSNDALRAYRPERAPMSLGQPADGVMAQALSTFEGVVIDPADPNSCIIYNPEIQLGLTQEPGVNAALKTALVENRTNDEIRELAASAPLLFVGVNENRNDAGEVTGVGLPVVKTTSGETCSLVFSSPAEVWAFDATLTVRSIGLDEVIAGARSSGHPAVMIDPMGPWAVLSVPAAA